MGWPMLAFGSGAAIDISNLHRGGLLKRARNDSLAERDLEGVVFAANGALERRFSDLRCESVAELLALEQGLGLARPPRNGGYTAKCDPGVADRAVLNVECNRGRRQREFVGLAVAHLEIGRARPASVDRKGGDQLARQQRGL